MNKTLIPAAAVAAVPVALLGFVVGMLLLGMGAVGASDDEERCGPGDPAIDIDPDDIDGGIHGTGWTLEQLTNAAWIMRAAADLDLTVRDQAIGVMTAIGESSLRILDHGDEAGPDSRGLFQQRDNGEWGSYEDRMDPYISSTNFFKALVRIVGDERHTLPPTIAAHRTQRNADPYHYEKWWPHAIIIVEGLTDIVSGLDPDHDVHDCESDQPDGDVNDDGWASPAAGPITSPFGWRTHPITGERRFHYGIDFGAACDEPIWAINDGQVVKAGSEMIAGYRIAVDHGGGVVSHYDHMHAHGILVNVHDEVESGDRIGLIGKSGWSTGCHLHFEVLVDGEHVDPEVFLAERSVNVG